MCGSVVTFFILATFVFSANSETDNYVEVLTDEDFEDGPEYYKDTRSYSNNVYEDYKKGRVLFSYRQTPIIDMVLQTASLNYVPSKSGDLFDFLRDPYPLPGGATHPNSEYDFVVIGAGSAGSALASRLTQNKNVTVLLLEAGKPEMLLTDVPSLSPYFQSTDYTWQYYMEPQPGVCLGMINQRCFWPRGKAVGGTSVVNYMIYTRGRPLDWDRIAGDGNYGWSYKEVLQYYMKSERASLKNYDKQPYRSRDGELPVEFPPVKTKLIDAFLEAGKTLGVPTVDYNAPDQLGFGKVQVTISNGKRQSAAKVFLHPHKRRRNLHILPETRATKVLIDPKTNTAYGVEYVRKGVKHVVRARKEVIVSAGPIASPQLLMLSGIGPKEHLSSLGIPVLKDLRVGRTLYDHICFPGIIFTLNQTNISFKEEYGLNLKTVATWFKTGDTILASPGAVEGIGYIKTSVSDDPDAVPDMELISIGGSVVVDGGPNGSRSVRRGMRITDAIFNEAFGEIDNKDTWSAFPMLLHPKSVGYLELKDTNPFSHPKMYGNYLTDKRDVQTFVAAIRYVQALAETDAFQKYGAKLHRASYPACRGLEFDSDEYWECAVRTLTATLHHQVATCRMGPASDPRAVVDPELRVHGTNRLRVVDSSVIPRTVSAHTNAPAIMIGEKAADMIKLTWGLLK